MILLRDGAQSPAPAKNASSAAPLRIGLVGTGHMARGFWGQCERSTDLRIERVLTRRPLESVLDATRPERLTNSLNDFLDHVDLVVEMTGSVGWAAGTVAAALERSLPVVTLNAEFQVTVGSYFVDRGTLTEAEGDQPGCLAALHEEAVDMGFQPWVYGNLKGFLNHHPTPEQMRFWSAKQGTSVSQTTSFTDGTKIQIEQALVANGLGAALARPGLLGPQTTDLEAGGRQLAAEARRLGHPISDYLLAPGSYAGVFLMGEHDERQQPYLEYMKMGPGPDYFLARHFHLCHLEVGRTVRRIAAGGPKLLDNSPRPSWGVAAIAKRDLSTGTAIKRGIGGFDVRGSAVPVADLRQFVPIGLLENVRLTRSVAAGDPVPWEAVEGIDELLLRRWRAITPNTTASTGRGGPMPLTIGSLTGERIAEQI